MIRKIISFPFIVLIRFYQLGISPFLPSACRHVPSCSQYMKESIEKHGVVKGLSLGTKRIAKCHPLQKGGYDPVP